MEKSKRVVPLRVSLYCDECGEEMECSPKVLTTDPAQYVYTCPNCSKEERSYKVYPYMKYIDEDFGSTL